MDQEKAFKFSMHCYVTFSLIILSYVMKRSLLVGIFQAVILLIGGIIFVIFYKTMQDEDFKKKCINFLICFMVPYTINLYVIAGILALIEIMNLINMNDFDFIIILVGMVFIPDLIMTIPISYKIYQWRKKRSENKCQELKKLEIQ